MARTYGRAVGEFGTAGGLVVLALVIGGCQRVDPTAHANESGEEDPESEPDDPSPPDDPPTSEPDPEDDESDSGSKFIPSIDIPAYQGCDPWNPDDCPDGEKCNPYATMGSTWDANKCFPILGDRQVGDLCHDVGDGSGVSGLDDCAEGLMCWDISNQTGEGYCIAQCGGSPNAPTCPGSSTCAVTCNGVLNLCLPLCDPMLAGTDCPNTDNVCVSDPGGGGFLCVLNASGGVGDFGTECQYVNSCNQGSFCASAEAVADCKGSQGCCTSYCDLSQPETCLELHPDFECVAWYEEGQAPPGYEHVGGCVLPE